jgi:hypothetical protein
MTENSIAMMPTCGFNPTSNMSRDSALWLKFVAKTEKIYIQTAKNGGEKKIGPYSVDGFCIQNKKIYEFLGIIFNCSRFQIFLFNFLNIEGCHFHGML